MAQFNTRPPCIVVSKYGNKTITYYTASLKKKNGLEAKRIKNEAIKSVSEREFSFYVDEKRSTPSVITEEPRSERCQDKGTNTRAANGDAGGQGSPFFKVKTDGNDGWNVDKSHTDATQYADEDVEELDRHGQRCDSKAQSGNDAAGARHQPKSETSR